MLLFVSWEEGKGYGSKIRQNIKYFEKKINTIKIKKIKNNDNKKNVKA